MNKPMTPNNIRLLPIQESIKKIINHNPIPDPSRNDCDVKRKIYQHYTEACLWIESMLLMIPSPCFVFDLTQPGKWLIVDGVYRLAVIDKFINNQMDLVGLEYLPELNGLLYSGLDNKWQRRIMDYHVFAYNIMPGMGENEKHNIKKRMNWNRYGF